MRVSIIIQVIQVINSDANLGLYTCYPHSIKSNKDYNITTLKY